MVEKMNGHRERLTPKQEKFCQLIASGKNYSDAYRESYDTKNMKNTSINRKSFETAKKVNIRSRIEELHQEQIKELKYTAKESFDKLQHIQDIALAKMKTTQTGEKLNDPDLTSAIKAEELKGKLAHLYIEKQEVSLSGDLKERANELRKELFGTDKE